MRCPHLVIDKFGHCENCGMNLSPKQHLNALDDSLRVIRAFVKGKRARKREDSIVNLNRSQAALLGRELVIAFNEEVGIARDDLVGIYRFLHDCYTEQGGCDHTTGICSCQTRDVLEMLALRLGYDKIVKPDEAH